jgi:hypothetical protein
MRRDAPAEGPPAANRSLSMGDLYQKPEDATLIFGKLMSKFGANLGQSLKISIRELSATELKARACAQVGRILSESRGLTSTQKEITCIFNEIFGDLVCSLYFAGCALDRPVQMVLRRVLELGVGTVYLWDLPHAFWGWKRHDQDLNFKQMLEHLGSDAYRSYVSSANPRFCGSQLLDQTEARNLYRDLSNAIHGKLSTFESLLPDRFTHTAPDWRDHLALVDKVENLLLSLWKNRFDEVERNLASTMPQLQRTP